jgi:hypothetical protein
MMNILPKSVAVCLLVGAGLVNGSWTERWGSSPLVATMAARFDSVPMTIGDWKATPFDLSPQDRAVTGARSFLARVYSDSKRGVSVSVLLLGGLPGKMTTHTPDVCYTGAGYTLGSPITFERHYGASGQKASFRTAVATRDGTEPSTLRIIWGWNASKGWSAPAEPRWEFASQRWLCKLYVVRETRGTFADLEDDPASDFLELLLPEIDRCAFSVPQETPSQNAGVSRQPTRRIVTIQRPSRPAVVQAR